MGGEDEDKVNHCFILLTVSCQYSLSKAIQSLKFYNSLDFFGIIWIKLDYLD